MHLLGYLNKIIEYSFYALFLIVPLIFAGNTSELFEFNKMWITFILTIIIGVSWFSKMIITKKVIFKRTIFDIPILLFLASQLISTIISLDPYISFWGYYSRFNGGLLSIITYIFLYYAFVSNFWKTNENLNKNNDYETDKNTIVKRSLIISIIAGFIVTLWSLPSHFGYDPTCLVFRGTLDVACWTNDFQPKIRIFGPLGQPNWLAGYMGILIPIAGAFILNYLKNSKKLIEPFFIFFSVCFVLFYTTLLYTSSTSGILASGLSFMIFIIIYIFQNKKDLKFLKNRFTPAIIVTLLLITFFIGVRIPVLEKFSFSEVQKILTRPDPLSSVTNPTNTSNQATSAMPLGGSDSGDIRLIVWKGAINVWKANPVIGSGVETFAFAYYKYRPIEHNNLSEWNFLYNKAHNEYLNYLATTGAFGLISYLSFISLFMLVSIVNIFNLKLKLFKKLKSSNIDTKDPFIIALLSSFISILIINFFGFSVVILNIYIFLIPAIAALHLNLFKQSNEEIINKKSNFVSMPQWGGISVITIIGIILIIILSRFWLADTRYALGFNYNNAGQYETAYPLLQSSLKLRREPVFLNEVAINDAILATGYASQNATASAQLAQTLAQESLTITEKLTSDYPHNVTFWKGKVRIYYTLSNYDQRYLPLALKAIEETAKLAPTDATIQYNLGVLYGQNNNSEKAVEVLENVVKIKKNYPEAHLALGIFYHDLATDPVGTGIKIVNNELHDRAIKEMEYLLTISPDNKLAKDSLETWLKEK